jgi:hypothetical protein
MSAASIIALMMEETSSSEMSVIFYQTSLWSNPESSSLHLLYRLTMEHKNWTNDRKCTKTEEVLKLPLTVNSDLNDQKD